MIAERKLKASAAFQRPHMVSPLKRQCQMLPHGNWRIVSTSTPKAANQASEMMISTRCQLVYVHICQKVYQHVRGQEKNPEENGISHIRPSSMDKPAITSV
jgi:hypothetical protein